MFNKNYLKAKVLSKINYVSLDFFTLYFKAKS